MTESYTPEPRKPRLIWSGRDRTHLAEPLPVQVTEIVYPNQEVHTKVTTDLVQGSLDLHTTDVTLSTNRLIWTNDNLVALTSLLHGDRQHPPLEGKVDLIYIDPPFAVQSDFTINIEIADGAADEKQPTLIEELAYRDTWKEGLDSYLTMLRDRLVLLKRLLAPTGSIYVHCDWHAGHYIKVLMDEVFGYENFMNEIVWKRSLPHNDPNKFGSIHDTILFYVSSKTYNFKQQFSGITEEYRESHYNKLSKDGRNYQLTSLAASGPGPARRFGDKVLEPPRGNHWRYAQEKIDQLMTEGRIVFTSTGSPRYVRYLDEMKGPALQSIWTDVNPVNSQASDRLGYPTQKPQALLERIIDSSSDQSDLILDCFVGSGTTAVAAENLGRRWIAIDCSKFAIHTTRKRLIEANAAPFSVENVGFYARADDWRDLWAEQPAAKIYRDALVEIYGGTASDGYAHLHGRKGNHWVHIGPLNAPVSPAQIRAIAAEAATTPVLAVDVLSADIPIDWDYSTAEQEYGVKIYAKVIPQAAIDAVRERVNRKQRRDERIVAPLAVHFFSPPDVEMRVRVQDGAATVVLTRLTVDLDDCLATQDAVRRAEIKRRITDWRALIDYWAVDWEWKDGEPFQNDWQAFRTRRQRQFPMEATHDYGRARGEHRIAVKVTDIFGNDGLRTLRVTV